MYEESLESGENIVEQQMTSLEQLISRPADAPCATGRVALWPEGKMPYRQDHQIGALTDESCAPGFNPDEHRMPYIEWFEPEGEKRSDICMILISGGGYNNCCDVGLIDEWRRVFTGMGIVCANLAYRTPRPKGLPIYASAWADGQRAVRLVRNEAARRGFSPEKIGAIAMSAGSHLATLLAVSSLFPAYEPVDELDAIPCHINWALTDAIAYGTTDACFHGTPGTRDGDAIDVFLDPAFKFDAKTCPMCMTHGGEDPYTPATSALVYRELRKRGIPAEVHLYPDRGHGAFGFDRQLEFMRQMGYLGDTGAEIPLMQRFASDDARADHTKSLIWPDGLMPDPQPGQCEPYIEWHFPKTLTTKAIQIIFAGGCYCRNDPDDYEVAPFRRYLNEKGMTVVTLKYRSPRPAAPLAKHTTAWQDLQRAVRIVRSEAAARGLAPDRIGIMGSSAGGHLALMGATSSKRHAYWPIDDLDRQVPCNVQWAVLFYPAYLLTDGIEEPNTTGGNDDSARLAREFSFDLDTPPMLFVHGDTDEWAAMNSVKTWEQLRRMGIQGELHTLALRGHCFQRTAAPGTGSYTCPDRIWEFLTDKKLL